MKDIINVFRNNKAVIENFISVVISGMPDDFIKSADLILKNNHFIHLMYEIDRNHQQISPTVFRSKKISEDIHKDKSQYFDKVRFNENNLYVSNPYIHFRTGKASVSVIIDNQTSYTVFDIDLLALLEFMRIVENNSFHNKVKQIVYTTGSALLALLAFILILFGGYKLYVLIMDFSSTEFLQDIFKSIISLTLGLAIFDLAKQIFEHEVLYDSFHHSEDKQYKVLGKFLISIVIAVSIETMMVIFKIALDDHTQMLAGFYLMIGTTLMFVGLGYYYKVIRTTN